MDHQPEIGLAELLGAFSLATDLGLGQPMDHVLRSWRIAARLADHMGLAEDRRRELLPIAMLSWVGCVADAPEVAAAFGDDIVFRADSYQVDVAGFPALGFFLGHAGRGRGAAGRTRAVAALLADGGARVARGMMSHCLTTSALAQNLDLGPDVEAALRQFFTRWDGRGVPKGVGGAAIDPGLRLLHLADVVEVHHRMTGIDGARRVAGQRRGTQFAPEAVDAFFAVADEVLGELTETASDDLFELLAAEPGPRRMLGGAELDAALTVLADFTDLRSVHRAGHSRGTAELAGQAARLLGLPESDAVVVRRAGLLHDIGLTGVPATILEKSGPLSATEWERIRLSSYYTERVLARPPALARIGAVAAAAHERCDGSGYHRGLSGTAIPMTGRVLAAACAFHAMTEPRAHRPALPVRQAGSLLQAEVRAGRFDGAAAEAVLAAATGRRRRVTGPAGLTPREVEVLVLISRGAATAEVARRLGVSERTAGTHIERIYTKTGASSRSTATLFAVRCGLLDPLDSSGERPTT